MAQNITLNSSNNIGQNNNTYQKDFLIGGFNVGEDEGIYVDKLIIPNSVCNISPELRNDSYLYLMGCPSTGVTTNPLYGTVTGAVSNSNVVTIGNPSQGYYAVGYKLVFEGLTTSTPILITALQSAYGALASTFTINQSITVANGTVVYGFICGNTIVAQLTAGLPPPNGMIFNPTGFFLTNSNPAVTTQTTLAIYATNTQEAFVNNTDNVWIFTLNYTIPTIFNWNYFTFNAIGYANEIVFPRGHYSITGLNSYIQQKLIENGHYWWDKVEKKTYFPISYEEYPTTYKTKRNLPTFPAISSIPTVYGTNAYFNDPFITNGNFNIFNYPLTYLGQDAFITKSNIIV